LCQSTRGITGSGVWDSQRGTYKKHTVACDTMNIHMQRQTTGMPYLLKDKLCIQQITRPRMGKNASRRATWSGPWVNWALSNDPSLAYLYLPNPYKNSTRNDVCEKHVFTCEICHYAMLQNSNANAIKGKICNMPNGNSSRYACGRLSNTRIY